MTNTLSATELRRWANQCRAHAQDPRSSGDERARLMTMVEALDVLANEQDWLDGIRKLNEKNAQASAA
jgi:hypothetical protein